MHGRHFVFAILETIRQPRQEFHRLRIVELLAFKQFVYLGMHIVRVELPLSLCEPDQRAALEAAARDFRRTATEEGFRAPGRWDR